MSTHAAVAPDGAMRWAPRVLALAVSSFLGAFSIDAFGGGTPILQALPAFLIHLVPSAAVATVVAIAWHREWIGATLFTAFALAYAVAAREHPAWIAVISGPLLITAALYCWTWMLRR
jgi:hypothetical protein